MIDDSSDFFAAADTAEWMKTPQLPVEGLVVALGAIEPRATALTRMPRGA